MYINILSTVENVEAVRTRAKEIPTFASHFALTIGASSTGELPPTHWFCCFNATPETYEAIKAIQDLSIIEEGGPKTMLEKYGLKMIKGKKFIEAQQRGELE